MAITGEYIKAKRLALNWTQQDLADKMNVTTRSVINWENYGENQVKIPPHTEEKLHEVLANAPKKGETNSPSGFVVYVPKSEFLKHNGRIIIEVI